MTWTRIGTATGVLAAAFVLAACGDGGPSAVSESLSARPTDSVTSSAPPSAEASATSTGSTQASPSPTLTSSASSDAPKLEMALSVDESVPDYLGRGFELVVRNTGTRGFRGHVRIDTPRGSYVGTAGSNKAYPRRASGSIVTTDLGATTVAAGKARTLHLMATFSDGGKATATAKMTARAGEFRSRTLPIVLYPVTFHGVHACHLDDQGDCSLTFEVENLTSKARRDVTLRVHLEDSSGSQSPTTVTWTIDGARSEGEKTEAVTLRPGRTTVHLELTGFTFDDEQVGSPNLTLNATGANERWGPRIALLS